MLQLTKESRLDRKKTTLGGFVMGGYSEHIADKVITHKQLQIPVVKGRFSLFNQNINLLEQGVFIQVKPSRIENGRILGIDPFQGQA